jgi:hypothetical protein
MILDKYLISKNGFRNTIENGKTVGFELRVNISYYHGIFLSLVNGFEINVDGEKFTNKNMIFTVHDHSYDFDEMPFIRDARWEFGEEATLTIKKPGGLSKGKHKINASESLNISYFPTPLTSQDSKTLELEE